MILDILKQKVSPDMLVVRRYKNDNNSPDRFVTSAPELFIDKIYDPNLADFNQVNVTYICKLLKIFVCQYF